MFKGCFEQRTEHPCVGGSSPPLPIAFAAQNLFLEGNTLSLRLAKGALPTWQVLRIGHELASALERAHRAGVVHRDFKPGNIMLTKAGAKLLDFEPVKSMGGSGLANASDAVRVTEPLSGKGAQRKEYRRSRRAGTSHPNLVTMGPY